jgi:arginine utilization protein RocB
VITEAAWAASGLAAPAVVVGFASMPYLPTRLRGEEGARLAEAVRRAVAVVGRRRGGGIGTLGFFPGISDMSFLGQVDAAALPVIAANTAAWGHGLAWPEGPAALGVPIVNAGPWGRDYHTPLERLHAGYAFEVLPDLLVEIVRGVLTEALW